MGKKHSSIHSGQTTVLKKPTWVFAKNIESEALRQFESAMQQEFSVTGALMPDAHTGYTLPIGGVIATRNVILPSWVGYDIGCGLCAVRTAFTPQQIRNHQDRIYQEIYQQIPTGFNHNKKNSIWKESGKISATKNLTEIFEQNGFKQLCSLGSGNHFIEIGRDETDKIWIIVHSGSRGIGHSVAGFYMRKASDNGKAKEGHFGFNVNSNNGQDYLMDMNFCLAFALENRKQIIQRVLRILHKAIPMVKPASIHSDLFINRNHNHVEFKNDLWIHRKGATQAEKGMLGVIPGNMRDGSFITEGRGNPDSLWSSSHGAGRLMSRKKAKSNLSLEEFQETMVGIKAKKTHSTLDESPFAYKDIFSIIDQQKGMVKVLHHAKPLINIKA